jgi:hypothetical protein
MPSAKEEANKIAADVKEATNESASDLSNAMGGGCSPQLAEKVLSSLTSVQGAVSKIQSSIGGTVSGLFMDDNLRKIYENAKKTNNNALLNEYIAEQNAMFNENRGYTQYDELLKNRYRAQGEKDLDELNSKNIEVTNLLTDLIKVTQQQNIAVDNMKKVMENLEEKNKQLSSIIYGGKGDLYTYNRKSMYEGKLKQSVENWTIIPELAYWTLVVLWVCIVMLYLKNVTLLSVAILIALILYPYFSTPIYLWVLDKIQSIWNFIFIAVHNRITV